MEYRIENLTKEEAEYIGAKINEIVPHELDADEEEFVLKIENENGEIIGGCIAEAYEYHWSRMFLNTLWVVTLGTASYMARPFYEKHGYTAFKHTAKPTSRNTRTLGSTRSLRTKTAGLRQA